MKYWTRKKGSQRASAAVSIEFVENFAGQGGVPYIVFLAGDRYHYIDPETEEDFKTLLRQAHTVYAHMGTKR